MINIVCDKPDTHYQDIKEAMAKLPAGRKSLSIVVVCVKCCSNTSMPDNQMRLEHIA